MSFDLPRSRVLGIVGNNGAGKTTLVRAISGILPPTEGRIEIRGRVSTLLALGVGFNPKLSGYENIMLGGLAVGYSRAEVEEKTDEIAEWTGTRGLPRNAHDNLLIGYVRSVGIRSGRSYGARHPHR